MNLDELRTVRRNERETDSLQHLRESFYRDAADYIASLKAERERAADSADDPFASPEVRRLTDEIETAEEVVEAVYERRVGKVVKRASFAAADMATEDEGLTEEERELFDDLVARIRENRERVLATIAGETPTDAPEDGTAAPVPSPGSDEATTSGPEGTTASSSETGSDPEVPPDVPSAGDDAGNLLADAMGESDEAPPSDARESAPAPAAPEGSESDAPTSGDDATDAGTGRATGSDPSRGDGAGTERTTVRVTRDVGSIFGVDEREYHLASEDVVALPTPNADPLLERDAAERID